MITVFFRTFFVYALLLLAMRFLGKRQMGELELSELITTFMLSELAATPILNTDIPIAYAVVPILLILSIEIILSFIVSRYAPLRKLFFGAPSILIYKGKINIKEIKKLRIGVTELLSELRLKDIADVKDVRCAILEGNGKLSVFPTAAASPLTKGDADICAAETGIGLPVLVGGQIMRSTMQDADVDEAWIHKTLQKNGLTKKEILLMTVDEQKHVVFILQDKTVAKIQRGVEK